MFDGVYNYVYILVDSISDEELYKEIKADNRFAQNVEAMEVFKKAGVTVWECRNCGHIVIGTQAPDRCPVCNHPQSYFEVNAENY